MHFSFLIARQLVTRKESCDTFPMVSNLEPGPLLAAVIDAEQRADHILRYPLLNSYAEAVVDVARELARPVLLPVGADAQRLLGAIEMSCAGAYDQYGWRTSINGRDVLLVAVVGVSGVEIAATARYARRLGASKVHACAADAVIGDVDELDSFTQLRPRSSKLKRRRSA